MADYFKGAGSNSRLQFSVTIGNTDVVAKTIDVGGIVMAFKV